MKFNNELHLNRDRVLKAIQQADIFFYSGHSGKLNVVLGEKGLADRVVNLLWPDPGRREQSPVRILLKAETGTTSLRPCGGLRNTTRMLPHGSRLNRITRPQSPHRGAQADAEGRPAYLSVKVSVPYPS